MRKSATYLLVCLVTAASCTPHAVRPPAGPLAGGASFEQALERGFELLGRGEYRRAESEFQSALAASPNSARARNGLGLCYFHQKDYDRAKDQFGKATAADPAYAAAYNNLGGVYFLKSDFPKAEELYKKALSLSPDLISANYSLGTLLCNLGRDGEGSGYLAHGIALDPEYLGKARDAGFADWWRILREPEFEKVREDPRIQVFLKIPRP
jgi:tetratricopeptide (TPR) repeat protein